MGPGEGAVPGAGCGKGRRSCRMESDVAFHFLHHLMNMAIEHGQRAKSLEKLERTGRILRAPAPIGRDCPQRNMGEDDDRRRSWLALEIVCEPSELFIAERAHAARFQISDIDEADEMRAAIVKGIPAAALACSCRSVRDRPCRCSRRRDRARPARSEHRDWLRRWFFPHRRTARVLTDG